MFVTYQPSDGERQRWEWDPDRVRQSEAEMVEKRYGKTWDQFKAGVMSGDSKARRVLLWHLLRREHHTLRYEDTPDFYVGELVVEFSTGELAVMRDRIMKANIPEDEREQMLTALDIQMADAAALESEMGKARSKKSDTAT